EDTCRVSERVAHTVDCLPRWSRARLRYPQAVTLSSLVARVLLCSLTASPAGMALASGKPDDMVLVPTGAFQMGAAAGSGGLPDEQPERSVLLSAFYIDRFEVTNEAYLLFVSITGHRMPENSNPAATLWKDRRPMPGIERHPVVNVSWTDSEATSP